MAALRWLGMIYVIVAAAAALAAVVQGEMVFAMLAAAGSVAAILCFAMDKGLTLLEDIRNSVVGQSDGPVEMPTESVGTPVTSLADLEARLARARSS